MTLRQRWLRASVFRDDIALKLLVDPGVIGGEQFEPPLAHHIHARVADVGHKNLRVGQIHGGQGGAHARVVGIGLRQLADFCGWRGECPSAGRFR